MDEQKRVLVIEDNQDIRAAYVILLQRAGHDVVDVDTVDEGYAMLARGDRFDAVVTDNTTPGNKAGVDLARAFGNNDENMRVIVVSAEGLQKRLEGSGATVFTKPVEFGKILAEIERVDEQEPAPVQPPGLFGPM